MITSTTESKMLHKIDYTRFRRLGYTDATAIREWLHWITAMAPQDAK